MSEREKEWLAALTVGAQVAIYRGYASRTPDVAKITRGTSRYWWIGEHQRFRKDNGRGVGGSTWHKSWLAEPTPDIFEARDRNVMTQRLAAVRWNALSTDALRGIIAALDVGLEERRKADAEAIAKM